MSGGSPRPSLHMATFSLYPHMVESRETEREREREKNKNKNKNKNTPVSSDKGTNPIHECSIHMT